MGLFNIVGSTATDVLQQTMELAQERQRVLADDVANIDTPGFKMRDIDVGHFEKTLAKAINDNRRANPNNTRLQLPDPHSDGSKRAGSDLSGIVFHDANNRGVEQLMVELSQNQMKHSRAASVLRNQLNLIKAVISETA